MSFLSSMHKYIHAYYITSICNCQLLSKYDFKLIFYKE